MVISEAGLALRVAGINRAVPWSAIDAVLVEAHVDTTDNSRTLRLVLVPAQGADLGVPAAYQNTVDGRPSVVLLDLDEIHDAESAIQALGRFAHDRFVYAPGN
ncbi:hypothetical protein GCM10010399_40120 [Dactylosporangium fulvum]|uniref:Uncharacterized protein n=1 Tax=Dactylosporangium fulvum TaxID=53359 RepID=A0ABY5W1M7_9ACTN|nr:hypothetical protein [Dactylosporangium fulvum]UWP83011.1 hypothetical protein Dfulv_01505 [Dactylosporangium fulvum]